MYTYAFRLLNVVDGDTVDMDWDLGGPHGGVWIKNTRFRFARINAPEKNTPEGKASMAALITFLEGKRLSGRSEKYVESGGFTRWLIDLEADAIPVSDWLVANGWAVYKTYA